MFKLKNTAAQLAELQQKLDLLLNNKGNHLTELEESNARLKASSLDEALGDNKAGQQAVQLESEIATLKRKIDANDSAISLIEDEIENHIHLVKRSERLKSIDKEIESAKKEAKLAKSNIEVFSRIEPIVDKYNWPIGVEYYLERLNSMVAHLQGFANSTAEDLEVERTNEAVAEFKWASQAAKSQWEQAEGRMALARINDVDHDRIAYHQFLSGEAV